MESFKCYPNVQLGENVSIGEYVILGLPGKGVAPGALPTIIGDNAMIRSHTVIYAGSRIGKNFQTGHHVLIREENTIGDDVSIGSGSVVEHHVIIKDRVRVHSQAFIPETSVLEEGCWIGPNVVITNAMYPLSRHVKEQLAGALVKSGAKIGANATLLPGITVGENALIGAGSVVTKDVGANKVVAGNPAREINEIGNLPY